jgi:hypothetical protein
MFETLKKMKSDKKQVFADIVCFDLIYHSEKKRENSNRGQKMSAKICQKFLYCDFTLDHRNINFIKNNLKFVA